MGLGLRERLRAGVGSVDDWLHDRKSDLAGTLPGSAAKASRDPPSPALSRPAQIAGNRRSRTQQILDNADRLTAKAGPEVQSLVKQQVGHAGLVAGNIAGAVDGVKDTAEGLRDVGGFALRLLNPADAFTHPLGEAAWDQLFGGVHDLGVSALGLGARVAKDPAGSFHDVAEAAREKRRELDPGATPAASTLDGEFRRNLDIGRNQGKLFVEVAPYAIGGGELAGARALAAATKASRVAKYVDQGLALSKAEYLAELYEGMGHHSVIRRSARLPGFLGGGPVPAAILDSPFNVLKPPGITKGDFYELHYAVDSKFKGARMAGRGKGSGWSGKRLGLPEYSLPQRIWYGTPNATKQAVATTGIVGTNPFGIGEE